MPVTVSQPGSLTLTGTDLVEQNVPDSATVNLLVKPLGKTKKKLNSKGKVSINATITYTPSVGQPHPLTRTVKLKKS